MPTAIIYVFSGTGNTLYTANLLKESLSMKNVNTQVYEIKKPFNNPPHPNDYDYVGFAYPVHAFNSPQFFLQFVRHLPNAKKKAFILKTSGEPFHINDASSYKLYRLLKKKQYDVVLERHLLMPYNIVFRYNDRLVKQMLITNQALCELMAIQLLREDRSPFQYRFRHRVVSTLFRIQWLGAKLNGHIYSINTNKCTKCMRCLKECPTMNISLKNGKFHFDESCAMCMRCIMFCPTGAINPGILRLWRVNGIYNFKQILYNESLSTDFINENTKGYFKLFRRYYQKAYAELTENGIFIFKK